MVGPRHQGIKVVHKFIDSRIEKVEEESLGAPYPQQQVLDMMSVTLSDVE